VVSSAVPRTEGDGGRSESRGLAWQQGYDDLPCLDLWGAIRCEAMRAPVSQLAEGLLLPDNVASAIASLNAEGGPGSDRARARRILFAVLLLVVLLAAATVGYFGNWVCGNTTLAVYHSPGGWRRAVVFRRHCGATTGHTTEVSVLPRFLPLPNRPGNVWSVPPQDILDFSRPSESYTLSPGYAAA
jgi:hypothetical protein